MLMLSGRAAARCSYTLALGLLAGAGAGWAAEPPSPAALELEEAATLAVAAQPLLERLDAQVLAARATAVAARQLPDPQLSAGVSGLPVNSDDAYSLTRDADTQLQIALQQEFPRAAKRRLQGDLQEREALRLEAERELSRRSIRRDAALAWLELWRYTQVLGLTRASLREAEIETQAVEIALRSGAATQADLLGARMEASRLQDAVAGAEQSIAHAQNSLSRWIGDEAFREVCPDLPLIPPVPELEELLQRVRAHPQLASLAAEVAEARTGAELAQARYRPDWRAELGYANRRAFSDLVTLQVGIDLPVFTRNRQDQNLAAALAQQQAAEFSVADALRQLQSEARLNHHDWVRLAVRLQAYDANLLPQSQSRIEAALAGWRSGRAMLRDVLEARRMALEVQMARLDLQYDAARHFVQLNYLGAFEAPAMTAGNSHE